MAARPSKAQKLIPMDREQDPPPESDPSDPEPTTSSMDPALWRFFPEDLMARVLSRLPLTPFFRFRCVCRLWNTLSHSPSFTSLHSQTPSTKEAWILIFADRGYRVVSAYIPTENKWHHIPLSFLPFDISDVTVAGGLLVFRWHEPGNGGDSGSSVCVCNPVTSEWRKLPPMLGGWRDGLLGAVVDEERGGKYKIVVRSNGRNHGSNGGGGRQQRAGGRTEVYDSERDGWVRTSGLDDGITTGGLVLFSKFLCWKCLC